MKIQRVGRVSIKELIKDLRNIKKAYGDFLTGKIDLHFDDMEFKGNEDVKKIIKYWNKVTGSKTKMLTYTILSCKDALSQYKVEQILKAIENYSAVKNNPDTWLYRSQWPLKTMLQLQPYKLPDFIEEEFLLTDWIKSTNLKKYKKRDNDNALERLLDDSPENR